MERVLPVSGKDKLEVLLKSFGFCFQIQRKDSIERIYLAIWLAEDWPPERENDTKYSGHLVTVLSAEAIWLSRAHRLTFSVCKSFP